MPTSSSQAGPLHALVAVRRVRKSLRGFSLVELMVTVVIVGVLAAIGLPMYQDYVTRARLAQAFEFADAARTEVVIDTADGPVPKTSHLFMNLDPSRSNNVVDMSWFIGKDTSGIKGYLLASVALKGDEAKDVVKAFSLEWRDNGSWYCVPGGKYGGNKAPAMDEKYLPSVCREGSNVALTAAKPACPAGQEMLALTTAGKTSSACAPQCPAGQTRDAANPTQCNSPVPAATVTAVAAPAVAVAPAAANAATAKTAPAAATSPADAAKAVAAARPSIQCHVCDPSVPELCELVTVETTCNYPNNFCMTFIDNHADGTKTVDRSCGNFERAYREWYQGTSDDDKCRERIDVEQHLDFTCTFACETGNCNQSGASLRPPAESLYQPK